MSINTFLKCNQIFLCANDSIRRQRWQNNTAGHNTGMGGHVGADHVPVHWNLDLNWVTLHTYIYTDAQNSTCPNPSRTQALRKSGSVCI